MNKIIFLGTGPFGGVPGKGKSKRKESSVLIRSDVNFLIDVTNDFKSQSKLVHFLDAVLVTHGHRDAIGGMAKLDDWLGRRKERVNCYAHPRTIRIVQKKFPKIVNINFQPIKAGRRLRLSKKVEIVPFPVLHSIQKGFPAFGFRIFFGKENLISYASDTREIGRRLERNVRGSEILILDGALWGQTLPAHLDVKKIINKVCEWEVGRIYFTQIGNAVPRYEIFKKWLAANCKKAFSAYDGLKINV